MAGKWRTGSGDSITMKWIQRRGQADLFISSSCYANTKCMYFRDRASVCLCWCLMSLPFQFRTYHVTADDWMWTVFFVFVRLLINEHLFRLHNSPFTISHTHSCANCAPPSAAECAIIKMYFFFLFFVLFSFNNCKHSDYYFIPFFFATSRVWTISLHSAVAMENYCYCDRVMCARSIQNHTNTYTSGRNRGVIVSFTWLKRIKRHMFWMWFPKKNYLNNSMQEAWSESYAR